MKTLTTSLVCLMQFAIMTIQAQDLAPFKDGNGRSGYKDENGKEIIPAKYDKASKFSEGSACVTLYRKWGFIDKTGKEIIPLTYDYAMPFAEGFAVVNIGATKTEYSTLGGRYGFIDQTGKEVIPLKYDNANSFSEGLAAVNMGATKDKYGIRMTGGKNGFIDKTGKEIIPLQYDYAGNFKEGLACVKLNEKWGFIDKTGKEIIPLKYEGAQNFNEGLAWAKLDGKWGFIDKTDKQVVPFKYDEVSIFSEGYATVTINKKHGFVDSKGNELTSLKYDDAYIFIEGLARVKLGDKYGYIDQTGKEVIPVIYASADLFFRNGKAKVGKTVYSSDGFEIDKTGKEIVKADKPEQLASKNAPGISSDEAFKNLAKAADDLYAAKNGGKTNNSNALPPKLPVLEMAGFVAKKDINGLLALVKSKGIKDFTKEKVYKGPFNYNIDEKDSATVYESQQTITISQGIKSSLKIDHFKNGRIEIFYPFHWFEMDAVKKEILNAGYVLDFEGMYQNRSQNMRIAIPKNTQYSFPYIVIYHL